MIPMLACKGPIPEWHFMVIFAVIGAMAGIYLAHLYYSWIRREDQRYIKGLKEDRECRDKYIEKLGGDPFDLPYCEDDDL